jgi:O-antigen/teichoic acid export membrane protein
MLCQISIGILLVRYLPVYEYSIYVIIVMIGSVCVVISSGGLNVGFTSLIGKSWPDKVRAKEILLSTLKLRMKFSLFALPIALFFGGYLLYKHNLAIIEILLFLILIVLNWYIELNTRLYGQIITFCKKPEYIKLVDTYVGILRLGLFFIFFYVIIFNVYIAYVLMLLCIAIKMYLIRQTGNELLPSDNVQVRSDDIRQLKVISKRQYPSTLFDCLKGQIVIIILAYYGNSVDTATYGALFRITQISFIAEIILQSYAIPIFTTKKNGVIRNLFLWCLLSLIPGCMLILISYFHPQLLLGILGEAFLSFELELFLMSISVTFMMLVNAIYILSVNRGWNRFVSFQIPIVLAWIVFSSLYLDLTKLDNLIIFQAFFPFGLLVVSIMNIYHGLNQEKL